MDFFEAISVGLGLATAAGIVTGAAVSQFASRVVVAIAAVPIGILICASSLSGADEVVWPAIPLGGLAALIGAAVSAAVVAGASERPEASPPGVVLLVVLGAALLAVLTLVIPVVSLVALVGLSWLIIARRRRADRKHEGLRVLR